MPYTFPNSISEEIWNSKYRYKKADGTPIDKTIEDTWLRVAKACAEAENEPEEWAPKFYNALQDFKFIPAGRILSGAGTSRSVTLFNCYVMGTIPDSMDGIFTMLREAALTLQQGGGIGYDFSTIRPRGSLVKGVDSDASGPLSFMDVWDIMCKTIMSAGSRRGAMMATMRCDHPDVLDFISAKSDPLRLRNFNVSVLCTDDFMKCVKEKGVWELKFDDKVYDKIRAEELWDKILQNTYTQAEPGVIFIDRINDLNNLWYKERISATNPCGEQPLPPYGACLLGSINLTKFILDPFGSNCRINYAELHDTVTIAVRMLDNVIDISKFPLKQQEVEAKNKRRIGLGVTGLADALTMLKVKYNTEKATRLTSYMLSTIMETAYLTSMHLAKEKGSFPVCRNEHLLESKFIKNLRSELREEIRKHGLRNSHLLSIAPTGTISLLAGNVSSGIEPIFAASYERNVTQKDGTRIPQKVEDYAVSKFRELFPGENIPDYFLQASDLTPRDHVIMQATAQKFVDSAISKTVNVPANISFDEFKQVYYLAYEKGCKGCTTYRPNDITGSILSETPKEENEEKISVPGKPESITAQWIGETDPTPRPNFLTGKTYKIKLGSMHHACYITINDHEVSGQIRPFEIFISTKDVTFQPWAAALTRMISAIFRRPYDASFVPEELKVIFDPTFSGFKDGKPIPSLLAAIGQVIEEHMKGLKNPKDERNVTVPWVEIDPIKEPENSSSKTPEICEKCLSTNLTHANGCITCADCFHSKCS